MPPGRGSPHSSGLQLQHQAFTQAIGGITILVDILIVVLFFMLIGSLPSWPYSRSWGYYGTGGIGTVLLIVVLLLLLHVF